MDLEITEVGAAAAEALLDRLIGRLADPSPAYRAIVVELAGGERELFDSNRIGPPDKADTRERKARDRNSSVRANASRTMVATGRLEEFLTHDGPGAQPLRLTKDGLLFGLDDRRELFGQRQAAKRHNPLVPTAFADAASSRILGEFFTDFA